MCCRLGIRPRQKLFAVVLPLAHHKLCKKRKIPGSTHNARTTPCVPLRRFHTPGIFREAHFQQCFLLEILQKIHSGHPLHDYAENMRGAGIVKIFRPRFLANRSGKESCRPVHIDISLIGTALPEWRRHPEKIDDFRPGNSLVGFLRHIIGKIFVNRVVYRDLPFGFQDADSNSHKTLADRIHSMQGILVKRFGVPFCHNLAMTHNQHAVHGKLRLLQPVHHCRNAL